MSLRFKVFTASAVVMALAIALCLAIYGNSRETNAAFSTFIDEDLRALEHIIGLRAALSEYERLQYEYYATADRSRISGGIAMAMNAVTLNLNGLRNYMEPDRFPPLGAAYARVQTEGERLNQIMRAATVDWDAARDALARMTEEGRLTEALLDGIFADISAQSEMTRARVATLLINMTMSVIGFVLLAIMAAVTIAYSTREALAADSERRRLAHFPERDPAAVFAASLDGTVLYANPSSHRLAEHISENLPSVLPADVGARIGAMVSSGHRACSFEYSLHDHVLSATMQLLPDLGRCHVYINDITERRRAEQELHFRAWHDAVTSLPDQGAFRRDCDDWINGEKPSIALLLIALLRFEQVARGVGPDIVDELVRIIATRLGDALASSTAAIPECRLYRLSGAGFALLIQAGEQRQLSDAVTEVAQAVIRDCARPFRVRRREFSLRPAVGVSICPDDAISTETLLRNASAALASLVRDNRQGVALATTELVDAERIWIETESALHVGIERGEFRLHYQPKVSAAGNTVRGFEALIRWQHGNRGLVSPADFIPVAEDSGLIVTLGRWILAEACRQASAWVGSGFDHFTVAVNVSWLQFQQEDFVNEVMNALETHQLPARYLDLEITESLLMQDLDHGMTTLHKLREIGVGLALDDFGTGYSSLEYLRRLPVSSLKIDRAFIQNLGGGPRETAIVRSMIDLAHSLDLTSVAEGVESAEQARTLRDMGCDELQGYHFCRPLDSAAVTSWWREASRETAT